jgi:hypothetical protein
MTNTYESLREYFNRVDPNSIADALRSINFGDVLRTLPVYLRGVAPSATGATPQQLASLGTVVLPEDAKAAVILRCTVKTCGVTAGEFTIEPYGTTPSTTQVAIAPNGDIVFLGSDAVTSADITYIPVKGDVQGQLANNVNGVTSLTLNVASTGFAALPSNLSGTALLLMQANVIAGTITGQKIIVAPATAVTLTTKAALSVDGTGIWFNHATDGVTQAVVDVLVYSGAAGGADVNTLLEAANSDT